MITPAQKRLYWGLWSQAKKQLMNGRKIVIEHELKGLLYKRSELEQSLEASGS